MSDYTEHYQLHQWQPQDKFLRTDFNEDLQKIDTALNGLAGDLAQKAAQSDLDEVRALATQSRFTKLKEFTSTEDSSFLEIYLNDIDWAQWDKVHMDVKPTRNGGSYFFYDTDASAGGGTEHVGSIGYNSCSGSWAPRMTFHVGYRADRTLDVVCGSYYGPTSITYAQLVKIVFSGSIMWAGAQFILWGEK